MPVLAFLRASKVEMILHPAQLIIVHFGDTNPSQSTDWYKTLITTI